MTEKSDTKTNNIFRPNNFTILIGSTNTLFDNINRYIGNLYIEQYGNSYEFSNIRLSSIDTKEKNTTLYYNIPYDKLINIRFNNTYILCKLYKVSNAYGTGYGVCFLSELSITSDNKKILEDFLSISSQPNKKLSIYHYDSKNEYWDNFGTIQNRDENTLIIDKNIKDKILNDVYNFTQSEDDYIKYGIPYKRNYLFYGKPGTGKTSLAKIIANKTKRSIYILSFDNFLTDNGLFSAVNSIKNDKSILLLEDIDCIFQNRSKNLSGSSISFSSLLNVLDGVSRSYGLITIITTNYVNTLDNALIRPGRVDMMIKFTVISQEQIIGLLNLYDCKYSSNVNNKLFKICKNKQLTTSIISGFLFRNRNNNLNDDNVIDIFNEYLDEMTISGKDNTYDNIYM
jgi:hypothetical protein